MHESSDPRERTAYGRLTWTGVLASYALAAAIPVLFWAASDPVAAGVVIAASAFVAVTARRARRLARCVRACEGLAFDLPGTVSVTVDWTPTTDVC